ncbi:oligosaccharide flippase family protein [Roseivirga thermotolerans]|uniref:Transporter n=1 Tax=Roseivirga thermotolerans TaxID=1758176 RepID=A0ABQ3I4M2_9BACT|nr:oligosaccharide flippase family protein [Roseivirga thermotolerans]GHE53381.1 transporter [Roseivirga thermotolerans]
MNSIVHRFTLILRGNTFSNFLHLSLNQGANLLTTIILTPFLFKRIGEDQYGLISLALTVTMLFGIIVNYGFGLNVPKQLALVQQDRERKQRIINEVVVTRLVLSLLLVLLMYVLTTLLGFFSEYSTILLFSAVLLLNDAVYPMFILQGFDRLSWISKSNAIAKILYLILVVLVVQGSDDAKWVNFILGVSGVAVNLVLLAFIYRYESIRFQWIELSNVFSRLLDNFQFFSSTIASYVLVNGGFILLSNFVTNTELGYYAVAQRISVLLRMIPVFITQSILQKATRLYEADRGAYRSYVKRSCFNGMLITLAVGVIVSVSAPWIIEFLTGNRVTLAIKLTRILSFLPFMGMLNIPNMIKILVTDRKQILAQAIWITALVMLLLSTAGAYFYGSLGMALALMVSEVFNYWIHHYLIGKVEVRSNFTSK